MTRGTVFAETMTGLARLAADTGTRPARLELRCAAPTVLTPWGTTTATVTGRVRVDGLIDDPAVTGTLEIAPIAAGRIRYTLDAVALDGQPVRLDGWKSVTARHPVASMTRLPLTIYDSTGAVVGTARVRFHLGDLGRFLATFRWPRRSEAPAAPERADALWRSRWRGQPGRLEVWYTTLTDPESGTGVWLHHELVAPTDGGPAYAHGWAAIFPPGGPPVLERFGPEPWCESDTGAFATGAVIVAPQRLVGATDRIRWDLTGTGGAPLHTFPRWAWRRELLPAAHLVPDAGATYAGTVRYGDTVLNLARARGASARIYGHGNARRWGWLHADLGDGDVLEVVAAVATRPGMRRLPPLPMLRLRVDGRDWPHHDPLLAAPRFRATLGRPVWTVEGRWGDRRLRVTVEMPEAQVVSVDYTDPDGAPAVCHNTERATASVVWQRRSGGGWRTERSWHVPAHAEIGER